MSHFAMFVLAITTGRCNNNGNAIVKHTFLKCQTDWFSQEIIASQVKVLLFQWRYLQTRV